MASFFLSPGVAWTEYDLTNIIPAVSVSPGVLCGAFDWGPIGTRVFIDSEATLVSRMGKPTGNNYETWFTGSSFLAYASSLYVSRAANTTSTDANVAAWSAFANVGAVANTITQTTRNDTDYMNKLGTYDSNMLYIAKYPGAPGNSLRISIVDSANAFSSNIVPYNAVANGTLTINAGSNVATIVCVPQGAGVISDANTLATGVAANLSVGDLLSVGNSTIGYQYLKIDAISNVVANSTVAAVVLNLAAPYRLSTNWSANTIHRYWEFYNVIGTAPGQSDYVKTYGNNNPSQDEMHIVIVDEGGYFSNVPGTVLEKYENVSRAKDAQFNDGQPSYYATVLNNSRYVRWVNDRAGAESNTALLVANSSSSSVLNLRFTGGSSGAGEANVSIGLLASAYDLYASPEEVDVGLIMAGKSKGGTVGEQLGNYIIDNITEIRKDCVAFISPEKGTVVNNLGNEIFSLLDFRAVMRSSSYAFLDSGYKQMWDRYNGVFRWVPLNGDCAGLAARTDDTNDPWWAFAGYNRGRLKNVTRLAFNPNKAARDLIFPHNINPVVFFPDDGPVLYGDKTLQAKASAFDAINVRRLFIVLEKSIAKAAKYFLWEFNDDFTRAQFRNMVNPYLRYIQGRRGITGFLVKCDSKNNPGEVIDRNIMVGDIYIKPNRAIRNIQLNFVATPTGVSFTEVELPN